MSALDLFGQSEPDRYPDAPAFRNTDTSREAAESVAPKLGRLQRLVLEAIKSRGAHGLTADECAETLGLDRYSVQPRTSELRLKGKIADSGKRRRNATGKSAIVWVAREFEQGPPQ